AGAAAAGLADREHLVLAFGQALFEVVDVLATGLEPGVGHDPLLQRDVGADAVDHHFRQGHAHARDRLIAVGAVHDQLADHRVVVRRHAVTFVDVRVHAHAGATGGVEVLDQAGRGQEGLGVLGVDPALDRVAAQDHVLLPDRQLLARGDPELLADQVDAGDHLGDRVLDLDAGVHLDEVEAPVLVQELERARAAIADADAGLGADPPDVRALGLADAGGRGFLDHLLVAALHRAVAFAQVDRAALAVGQHLDLHVARVLQELLHVDHVVAERGLGLGLGRGDGVGQRGLGLDHAHAAPAAAAGGLDDDRVADLRGQPDVGGHVVAQRAVAAGHAWHAGLLHRPDRLALVAHQADGVGLGPDEDEARLLHALGEVGVLAEEAVAGVDRLGVGDLGRGDDRRHVQVAAVGRRRTDADRLVGHR